MIVLIVVNYHCESHVVGLHRSLTAQDSDRWRLVVVDNGSDEQGAALLADVGGQPGVEVLDPGGNLGYLGAVQHAVDVLPDTCRAADWLVVSNPDIRFDDPGFLRGLESWDAGPARVLAPSIVGPDGRDQNPFMDQVPSRALTTARTVAALSPGLTAMAEAAGRAWRAAPRGRSRREEADGEPVAPGAPRRVFAPHGSFMCFSAGYLDTDLAFHHDLFLYGEEVAIAARCAAAEVPVVWVPELRVQHSRHATTAESSNRIVVGHRRRGALWSRRVLASVRRQGGAQWPSLSSS